MRIELGQLDLEKNTGGWCFSEVCGDPFFFCFVGGGCGFLWIFVEFVF